MAATISCFSGGVVFTSRSLAGSCTSAGAVGGGLFRTSLKCSAHLFLVPLLLLVSVPVYLRWVCL